MSKKIGIIFVGFVWVVIFLGSVNANFVCGGVVNEYDDMSPDWFEVQAYFPHNSDAVTTCGVSPEGNKYCCDLESIPPQGSWNPGDTVDVFLFDSVSGYVAGPQRVVTTGEGYTLASNLFLRKVIDVTSPSNRLLVQENPSFLFEASVASPFTHVFLENDSGDVEVCENCSLVSLSYPGAYGMNDIVLRAEASLGSYSGVFPVAVVDSLSYERVFTCDRCRGNRIRGEGVVNVSLRVDLSHPIDGLLLYEFVPASWYVSSSSNVDVVPYSESHDLLIWNVSGQTIQVDYLIVPPADPVFPKKYVFSSSLGGYDFGKEEVRLYKFFPFFGSSEEFKRSPLLGAPKIRKITPSQPVVLYGIGPLDTVAFFPKNMETNLQLTLTSDEDSSESFSASTYSSLGLQHYDRVYLEFNLLKEVYSSEMDLPAVRIVNHAGQEKVYSLVPLSEYDATWTFTLFVEPFSEIYFVDLSDVSPSRISLLRQ